MLDGVQQFFLRSSLNHPKKRRFDVAQVQLAQSG
jgi:hypothetical protein